MRVLITSASNKVSLVRAFRAALERTGGGEVVAADVDPLSAALYVADMIEIVPRSDAPAFVDAMVEICERHQIDLIVPTRDEELPVFAAARNRLESLGVRVAVSDLHTVETCQDKLAFHGFCVENDIGVARRYASPRDVGFPAFVRPRSGKGGFGVAAVRDRAELDRATGGDWDQFVVQDLIEAPEYTIDLLADFDGDVVSVVSRQRIRTVSGESWVGRVEMREDLLSVSRRLAEVLSFRGHVTIQAFISDAGVLAIEVNPRFGGAAALGWAAGAPTPEYLVRLVRGHDVLHDARTITDGLVMLRHTDDVFLPSDQLVKQR